MNLILINREFLIAGMQIEPYKQNAMLLHIQYQDPQAYPLYFVNVNCRNIH